MNIRRISNWLIRTRFTRIWFFLNCAVCISRWLLSTIIITSFRRISISLCRSWIGLVCYIILCLSSISAIWLGRSSCVSLSWNSLISRYCHIRCCVRVCYVSWLSCWVSWACRIRGRICCRICACCLVSISGGISAIIFLLL